MTAGSDELDALCVEAHDAIAGAPSRCSSSAEVRARFLGAQGLGLLAAARASASCRRRERKAAGDALNRAAKRIEDEVAERERALERASADQALARARARRDAARRRAGRAARLHPVTRVERDMAEFFAGLGFSVEDGPEVETEWNNFDALSIAADHPSRDTQDTFFVAGGHVLRTHTSPVQIRAMTGRKPPFRFIAPGRVFRVDFDATHSPMFHQIEGFMVDERVTLGDLKGVLYAFARHLMGRRREAALPRALLPVHRAVGGDRLLRGRAAGCEWGGCGMIHPGVLENCGIDPDALAGLRLRHGDRPHRDAALRHPEHPPHVRRRHPRARAALMRVSLGWLARVDRLCRTRPSCCERLTLAGLEIEEHRALGPGLSALRVGHVLERAPAPERRPAVAVPRRRRRTRAARRRVRRAQRRGGPEGRGGAAGHDAARRHEAQEGEDPRRDVAKA